MQQQQRVSSSVPSLLLIKLPVSVLPWFILPTCVPAFKSFRTCTSLSVSPPAAPFSSSSTSSPRAHHHLLIFTCWSDLSLSLTCYLSVSVFSVCSSSISWSVIIILIILGHTASSSSPSSQSHFVRSRRRKQTVFLCLDTSCLHRASSIWPSIASTTLTTPTAIVQEHHLLLCLHLLNSSSFFWSTFWWFHQGHLSLLWLCSHRRCNQAIIG